MAPAVAGDVLVIGSCEGTIHGLDVERGTSLWSYDTRDDGEAAQFHGEALVENGTLYIGADGLSEAHLYAIDVESGKVRWKRPFRYGIPTRILGIGGSIAFVTGAGELVSVDSADGGILWKLEPGKPTAGRQRVSAISDGSAIIHHTGDGRLLVVDGDSGKAGLDVAVGSAAAADPVLLGNQIYLGAESGEVVRVDATNGKGTARFELGGRLYGALGTDGERIFALVMDQDGTRLVCLDPALDTIVWERRSAEWTTFRPLIRDGRLDAGSEGQFCSFRSADAEVIDCMPIDGTARSFARTHDAIIVGTIQGRVMAFGSR